MAINSYVMATDLGNPDATLPKGEPVAKPEQSALPTLCDPRDLMNTIPVMFEDIVAGMWVRCVNWSRPRLVLETDMQNGKKVVFLAEMDASRAVDGVRRVAENDGRCFLEVPRLRQLWTAAHPV